MYWSTKAMRMCEISGKTNRCQISAACCLFRMDSKEAGDRYLQKMKLCYDIDPYSVKTVHKDVPLTVTFAHIYQFMVLDPNPFTGDPKDSAKGMDSVLYFKNGWVKNVTGSKIRDVSVVHGVVHHSFALNEKPLRTWVLMKETGDILAAHCTCAIGILESCSHIGATLFALDGIRTEVVEKKDSPDLSVRHATAGAFRNLSVQIVEICENMVDQDVLTPLLALLNQYTASAGEWKPTFDKTMQDQMDEKSDIFLQAVNLLWNLCESTSVALDSFNQSQLLESFVRCLNVSVYGKEIAVAVAQCLLVISEDNAASWRILSTFGSEISSLLTQDGDNPRVLLRTVAAGIIANVPALSATYLSQLFLALSKTLEVNHRTALNSVTSSLPLLQQKDVADLEVTDDAQMEDESPEQSFQRRWRADMPSEVELEIRNVGWLLQAQRIAAEILTNVCSTEEEEWQDDMDDDNLSEAESVHDYETNGANVSVQNTDKLPVEALEAIKSLGLVEKLWQKAQPIAENVGQILAENDKNLLKRVNNLRASSMLCLHNLCNNISSDDLGGAEGIYQVWLELGQQVFQGHQNPKLLEASTSLMHATLEHLRKNPELFKQMTESDLQLMLNGVNECQDAEIRANWLRMLGILGCLLPEPLIKLIIDFVLTTCLKEQDIWTISEAMDSMMDIFADNDWNQVVHDLGMVAKCKEMDRRMKAKLKQNKRELNERYPAVSTVRTNLSRFCKYLETEMKKSKPTTEA